VARESDRNRRQHRAIIAALVSAKATDAEERIGALTSALAARGVEVVGTLVQRRGVSRSKSPGGAKHLDAPLSSATFIGSGKVEELARLVNERKVSVVFFLNDLSSAQVQRLASLVGCAVVPCSDVAFPAVPV
jgi:50S ribosomal subunit-associated GTPase HflX